MLMNRRLVTSALACLVLALPLAGQMVRQEKAEVSLLADRSAYEAGAPARLAVVLEIEPDWHVNSHHPNFDYLIPTAVDWSLPAGWPEPAVTYPEGEMQSFGFAEEPLSVYQGRVAVIAAFELPRDASAGSHPVTAEVTYQACNDRQCLPPVTVTRTVELSAGGGGGPIHAEIFAGAAEEAPVAAPLTGSRLALMFALAVLGGLILNAMPCVLPVLSLKVFGIVKNAGLGRSAVVSGGLATSAGILVSFWALAIGVIAARSAGSAVGWGVQFQNPIFVTALAVVVLLFSLNLWGFFEIQLPAFLSRAAGSGPREGLAGHFASGLFATLMATPCSAPFLGSAVGFALSQSAATVLLIFTGIGLGMALPYLLLAAAPGTARLLPRPGAWMETLKGVMGFLLAAALVWLFYVLAGQIPGARVALIELSLLGLGLFVWLQHRTERVRRLAQLAAVACIVAAVMLSAGGGRPAEARGSDADELIAWQPFDLAEAQRLVADGKLVFVDVTADWCFTCKVNERMVLGTPEVAEAFARNEVVAMKADWTNRDDAIADYMAGFGRYGIPFYLLYRPGRDPHLFGELIRRDTMVEVIDDAGR